MSPLRAINNTVSPFEDVFSNTGTRATNPGFVPKVYEYFGERGVIGGGYDGGMNDKIGYIAISSTGNATDFGEFNVLNGQTASTPSYESYLPSACSSNTRGLWANGSTSDKSGNTIQYVTIQTKGNSIDFGDSAQYVRGGAGCSSPTRGLFGGGNIQSPAGNSDMIEYVTIASLGNAADFGNLVSTQKLLGACSSHTRGVWGGGVDPNTNVIQYITIASTGNATDFGDLTWAGAYRSGFSDCHGGLA